MMRLANFKTARAFTLLEVMVAVVVFAIVLAAINGVFWGALRLRKNMAESIDAALPAEQALAIIRNDLVNIVPPGGTFFTPLQTTTASTNTSSMGGLPTSAQRGVSSPQFTTSSGAVDDRTYWSDVQRVSYYLSNHELHRTVTRNLLPVVQQDYEEESILTGVESIYFYYHDGSQWKAAWDPATETLKMPRAIKVQIAMAQTERGKLAPPALELVVPIVDAGTNTTQVASTQ